MQVSLYRFPACNPSAPSKRYLAHAPGGAAIVRFACDDAYVLTAGGADGALLQWRYSPDADAHVAPGAESCEDEDVATDLSPLSCLAAAVPAGCRRAQAPVGAKRALLQAASFAQAESACAPPFWAQRAAELAAGAGTLARQDEGAEPLRRLQLSVDDVRDRRHAPAERLTLEYVHGVRAHGARGQLLVSCSGELVYFAGAVCVLMAAGEAPPSGGAGEGVHEGAPPAQRFYTGHGAEVLCSALHPGGLLVASAEASQRAPVHVWSTRSLAREALLAGGQRDGVGALAFSPDGALLASADLSLARTVALWNWRAGTLLSLTRGGAGTVLGLTFSPVDSSMVSYGQRHVRFWARPGSGGSGGWVARKGHFGPTGAQTVLCAAWLPSSGVLVTGTSRGLLLEWGADAQVVRSVRLHALPLFAIAASTEGIAVGGRGGRLLLWPADGSPLLASAARPVDLGQLSAGLTDAYGRCLLAADAPCVRALVFARGTLCVVTRSGAILQLGGGRPHCRLLLQSHCAARMPASSWGEGGPRSELWGLAAHPRSAHLFASAGDDCTVRIWDANQHRGTCVRSLRAPAHSLTWAANGSSLAVGLADGSALLLEPESLSELAKMGSPGAGEVTALAFSPDCALLAIGHADGQIIVRAPLAEGAPEPLRLRGAHAAAVRSLDWSADGALLQSSCTALLGWWDVRNGGERVLNAEQVADVEWETWTSPIGWPVAGILTERSDGSDIHAVSRSHSGALLVSANEFGKVSLFDHPASVDGAPCRVGVAHAGHVSAAVWACDDSRVFTAGGADLTVMQWRVDGVGREGSAE
ncbi:WD40-repeat-containing domain protein [Pavlovales sp. CCMP2436]|nr:WD40-repeat-containing domain protein [Pavlovales sp. CCMP2436]